ncbi:MAG: endonuclease [Paludibacteraceae bacterium]|nr:endonuclease [Paludibacteraceae bacterium]
MKKETLTIFLLLICACASWAEPVPVGYYNRIDGLQDSVLKGTLKQIIRPHHAVPYGDSTWIVFYHSDRDENGLCMDMYCDDWKPFPREGGIPNGCNIEHSFAKSWWGGTKNNAYQDCFHLNPSNEKANGLRSNYPLGVPVKEFKDNTGSLRIGKIHHDELNEDFFVFEPKDEYKGDFARAYFYMATCYGRDINGKYPDLPKANKKNYEGWKIDNKDVGSRYAMQNNNYLEFQPWEAEVLIKWHRQDPVSEKERKRADAVSDFQHNHNPFIDYPELAEYIWGDRKHQPFRFATTDLSETQENAPSWSKVFRNGQIYIVRDDATYDLLGNKVDVKTR